MNKQQFIYELGEFETAELYLTDKTNHLNDEIYHNMVQFGLTYKLAEKISTEDILLFLSKVKSDRQKQLHKSEEKIGLLYYLWFDEMAGQLRFNFINSNHNKLPFGCNLEFVETEKIIVDNFIESYRIENVSPNDYNENQESESQNETYALKIYSCIIEK